MGPEKERLLKQFMDPQKGPSTPEKIRQQTCLELIAEAEKENNNDVIYIRSIDYAKYICGVVPNSAIDKDTLVGIVLDKRVNDSDELVMRVDEWHVENENSHYGKESGFWKDRNEQYENMVKIINKVVKIINKNLKDSDYSDWEKLKKKLKISDIYDL
ncbi:hypothetical protein KY332_00150 [Candidatus Woesearchaeota archaeon]|nr:hypothetical protein [Candidatus Woesearchaeota archaeon]